jgi:hypothetical protein
LVEHSQNLVWEEEFGRALMLKFPRSKYTKVIGALSIA